MGTSQTSLYLPWADDALVRGESLYAVLNKLAWFAGRGPLQLIRDLKATVAKPSPTSPQYIDFVSTAEIWKGVATLPQMPLIHGLRLGEYIDKGRFDSAHGYNRCRSHNALRYCQACMSAGMHFDVTQLEFIEHCPHHKTRIISHCSACGSTTPYSCIPGQDAFSCESCKGSFLSNGLTDLRANLRDRRKIAQEHARLVKRIHAAPNLYLYGLDRYTLGRHSLIGLKHVMTRMLDDKSREDLQSLSVSAPYFAVKVERNDQGRPTLKRLPSIALVPQCDPTHRDEYSERRLAQLRVGAWALQHFRQHIACICAARELLKGDAFRRAEFSVCKETHACSIGRGFAAWESGHAERAGAPTSDELWEAWGLDDRSSRSFAFYILEKACLGSAILSFIENDRDALMEWERRSFALDIYSPTPFKADVEQAVLWVDMSHMDVDSNCDLHFRAPEVQLQWLDDVIRKVRAAQADAAPEIHPDRLTRELLQLYGADSRGIVGAE